MSDTPRPPDFPAFEDGADDPHGFGAPPPGAEGFDPTGLPPDDLEPRPFDPSEFDLVGFDASGFDASGFDASGFDASGFAFSADDPDDLGAASLDAASLDPSAFEASADEFTSDAGWPAASEAAGAYDADATTAPTGGAPPALGETAFAFADEAPADGDAWSGGATWPLFAEEEDVSLVPPDFELPVEYAFEEGPTPAGGAPLSALGSESIESLYDAFAAPDVAPAEPYASDASAFGGPASGPAPFDGPSPGGPVPGGPAGPPAVFTAPPVEGEARPFDPYAPAAGNAFDPLSESFGAMSTPYGGVYDGGVYDGGVYDSAYEPLIGAEPEPVPAAPPEAPAPAVPAAALRRGKGARQSSLVLGVHVLPNAVLGVLMRVSGERYEPLRHLVRHRTAGAAPSAAYDPTSFATPAEVGAMSGGDDGVTVSFGAGPTVDLEAEFAGFSNSADSGLDAALAGSALREETERLPIVFELRDMLEECAAAGYDRPTLAFSIGPPDVEYAEVVVPAEKKLRPVSGKKKGKAREAAKPPAAATGAVRREKLLALLPKEDVARSEKERISFVPMTPRDGERRYLAVLPQPAETVAESLDMLREQSRYRRLVYQGIDAEVPLLMGMVRLVCPAEPHENTAFVRVGTDDTLVLLFTGNELHHYELLSSVTAFDGPDTVCSRVLLQQDVQGIGTVHNVIVMSEEREPELVQGFAAFYPEARVETLRDGMARVGVVGDLPASHVEAAAAGLAGTIRRAGLFEESHLLPKHLRGKHRRIELALAWHTLVAAMLLFLSVVFFVGLYISNAAEIAEAERRLAEFPPEAHMTIPQLQTRIDSLRQAQAEMTASLAAMDSLLYGTDLWTQTLLRTTRAASATGGIWIEDWTPAGAELTIHGFATGRARVVSLAQRLSATIQEVAFRDLRDYPVYEYRMTMALPNELPQVSRFLREQAGEPIPPAPVEALAGIDPVTGLPSAPAPTRPAPPAPAEAPPAAPEP